MAIWLGSQEASWNSCSDLPAFNVCVLSATSNAELNLGREGVWQDNFRSELSANSARLNLSSPEMNLSRKRTTCFCKCGIGQQLPRGLGSEDVGKSPTAQ